MGHAPARDYDRDLGLFPDELLRFIEDSQPQQWQQLVLDQLGVTYDTFRAGTTA